VRKVAAALRLLALQSSLGSPGIVKFPVSREFVWRPVRSGLRRQPAIPAFGPCSQERRDWAGNAGFSRIRFRLRTPGSRNLRSKSPKVSGFVRGYSRFTETIGGDSFDPGLPPEGTTDKALSICLSVCVCSTEGDHAQRHLAASVTNGTTTATISFALLDGFAVCD